MSGTRTAIVIGLCASAALAACNGNHGDPGEGSAKAVAKGSSGGFSAGLSDDLAKDGSGSGSGSAIAIDAGSAVAVAPTTDAGAASAIDAAIAVDAAVHSNVVVPAELAAIKLELLPSWTRDFDAAGTLALSVPRGNDSSVFTFHYGYDEPTAPADREAYKKWLHDQKLLDVLMDRQRGAAWYLEGKDASGAAAFRYLVNYGGKHLICVGSLYKDAESNKLGKLRDGVVIQAKKICETLSL